MTSFSLRIQTICLGLLFGMMLYTLWLLRSGRLSAHLTVRWVLAAGFGMVCLVLWRWLPVFAYTSTMGDRELLVILAVVSFVFVAYLMLDSLVRISTHTHQIKLLTQELALLRELVDRGTAACTASVGAEPLSSQETKREQSPQPVGVKVSEILVGLWVLLCVGAFLAQIRPGFPGSLKALLTAGFKQ